MQNYQEYQFSNLRAGWASGCISVYSCPNNLPRQEIMHEMNLRPPTGIRELEGVGEVVGFSCKAGSKAA